MAIAYNFTAADFIFPGEDKVLEFGIYESDGVTPVDVTGWTIEWVLKLGLADSELVIEKTTGSPAGVTITGVYNVDPDVNTQRVQVALADTDTDGLAQITYTQILKRTDADVETTLSVGDFVLWSGARFVTLQQAKDQIRDPSAGGSTADADLMLKLAAAEAVVLDYCRTTAAWRTTIDAWTAATVPLFVRQAILIQFAEFWRFRGDDLAGQTAPREPGHDLAPVVEALLRRTRDPVVQ